MRRTPPNACVFTIRKTSFKPGSRFLGTDPVGIPSGPPTELAVGARVPCGTRKWPPTDHTWFMHRHGATNTARGLLYVIHRSATAAVDASMRIDYAHSACGHCWETCSSAWRCIACGHLSGWTSSQVRCLVIRCQVRRQASGQAPGQVRCQFRRLIRPGVTPNQVSGQV